MASIETIGIEFDTSGLKQGQKALADTEKAAQKTTAALDATAKETKEVGASSSTASTLTKSFAGAISLVAVSAAALKAIKLADEYTLINARLKGVVQGTEQFTAAQSALFQIAQNTRTSLSATTDLYTTLARSTKDLGISQASLLKITETFNKAITLGGGSATSAAAAITQFNQAMASGVLRGEEFNSMSEQAPRILDVLAQSLGKTRSELRAMAEAGLLTSDVVLPAILDGAASVSAEFEKMPLTVAGAMQQVENSLMLVAGATDSTTSTTGALAAGLHEIAVMFEAYAIAIKEAGGESEVAKTLMTAFVFVVRTLAVAVNSLAGGFVVLGKAIGASVAVVASVAAGEFRQASNIMDAAAQDITRVMIETMNRNRALIDSEQTVAENAKKTAEQQKAAANVSAEAQKQAEEAAKKRQQADLDAFVGASKTAKYQAEVAKLGVEYGKALAAAQGDPAKMKQVTAAYQERRTELEKGTDAYKNHAKAVKAGAAAANQSENAYQSLIRSLMAKEIKQTVDTEEARVRMLLETDKALKRLSPTQKAYAISLAQANDAIKEAAQWAKDYQKSLQDMNKLYSDAAKSNQDMIDRAQEELDTIGLTKSEIAALNVLKQETLIIDMERAAVMAGLNVESVKEIRLAKERLEALKKVLNLVQQGEQKSDALKAANDLIKEQKKAAEKVKQEWEKTTDSIGDAITDALMRGFEDGKGFAKNLRDTVVNMFKTMVLQPRIKAVITTLMGGGSGGTALAGTGGGGGLTDIVSTGKSLWDAFSGGSQSASWAAGLGTAFANSAFGAALGLSNVAGATAALGSTGLSIAGSAGTLTAAGSALVGVASMIPVIGAIAAAAYALFKVFGKKGGPKQGGTATFGEFDTSMYEKGPDQLNAEVEKVMKGFGENVNATLKNLGVEIGDALGGSLTFDTDPKGKAGTRIWAHVKGQVEEMWSEIDIGRDGDLAAGFQLQMSKMLLASIKNSKLPQEMADVFNEVDIAGLDSEGIQNILAQLQAIKQLNDAFIAFGDTMPQLSGLTWEAKKALTELSGGIDALAGNLEGYYQNFYTEAERQAIATRQMTEALADLGYGLPKTRDEYRKLVEAQDLSTESGRENYTMLLKLAGAFAGLTQATDQATQAVISQGKERKAMLVAQREIESAAILKQAEASKAMTDQFAAASQEMLASGDAAGFVANAMKALIGTQFDYVTEVVRQNKLAAMQFSAIALEVRDVGNALKSVALDTGRYAPMMVNQAQAMIGEFVSGLSDSNGLIRQAVTNAVMVANEQGLRAIWSARDSGIAGVMAAMDDLSFASFGGVGKDVSAFGDAMRQLSSSLASGEISAAQYAESVARLNSLLPEAAELYGDVEAQQRRIIDAQQALADAGQRSIQTYFGQLQSMADKLATSAENASEPINVLAGVIDRLKSVSFVFGQSAAAANMGGASVSADKASLIAQAAAIAGRVLTTADAAKAMEQFGLEKPLAELLDGIQAFDPASFERGFTRINAAFAKGTISAEDYVKLVNAALDISSGVADGQTKYQQELEQATSALDALKKAASSLADQLLLDKGLTTLSAPQSLAEAKRQYDAALATGVNLDAATKTYLNLAKENAGTAVEYGRVFATVISDLRGVENRKVDLDTKAFEQDRLDFAEVISQLKALREDLRAGQATIAQNTGKTAQELRQWTAVGLPQTETA